VREGIERLSVRLCEDVPLVSPELSCPLTFSVLLGLVLLEKLDERRRKPDHAATGLGLGATSLSTHLPPLRAVTRLDPTAGAAFAAMDVLRAEPSTPNTNHASVEVNVLPFEAQGLALTEAQGESEHPAGTVAFLLARHLEQLLDFADLVGLEL